ncbi:MAG: DUF481 domain-containing protein [Candidatus Sulfotelmatobacter sp.]
MKKLKVAFWMIVLFASPLFAREKSDTLVMRNGDRLTCEIKSLSADVLYIGLDYALGTVSINWFKVDHLESHQLFVVKTQDGEVYSGRLSMSQTAGERPVSIEVVEEPDKAVELERSKIANMDQSSQNLWERFNGSIGLGVTYNKGNQSTQYNLSTDVNYPRDRWSASASYNSNLTANKGTSPSSRNQIDMSAQRLMPWNNWYYTGFATFLQSTVQGIHLSSSYGGGAGRTLKNSSHFLIAVGGGFAFQHIDYGQSVLAASTQNVSAAWLNTQVKLFRFDQTNLTVTASLLPAISDPGRLHFNLNSAYYVKIFGKFNFNVSFYGNWDNQPPPGFSGSDYGTSAGVNWNFGNR